MVILLLFFLVDIIFPLLSYTFTCKVFKSLHSDFFFLSVILYFNCKYYSDILSAKFVYILLYFALFVIFIFYFYYNCYLFFVKALRLREFQSVEK